MIAAIPTRYNGVTFRSRLEARWAVFFDALAWPWSYESVDLEKYIPEFFLRFEAGPLAVEVKPVLVFDELRQHGQKIATAGWAREFLVLGAEHFGGTCIGAMGEPDGPGVFIDRGLVFMCLDCGRPALRGDAGSWRCRLCGSDDGNAHAGDFPEASLQALWREAGNRVQWRAPQMGPEAAE